MQNFQRMDKNDGPILSRLWTNVHEILRRCRKPLVVSNLPDYVYPVSFGRYRPLNLRLICEVVENKWFLGPLFVGGRDTPDFGHTFSNRTHFRVCDRFWLSSVQWAARLADKKEDRKDRRIRRRRRWWWWKIAVKPVPTSDCVGWPSYYNINSMCIYFVSEVLTTGFVFRIFTSCTTCYQMLFLDQGNLVLFTEVCHFFFQFLKLNSDCIFNDSIASDCVTHYVA